MTENYRSKCCDAKVKIDGEPDFIGDDKVCTVSYVCLKCGKPCDVKEEAKPLPRPPKNS